MTAVTETAWWVWPRALLAVTFASAGADGPALAAASDLVT